MRRSGGRRLAWRMRSNTSHARRGMQRTRMHMHRQGSQQLQLQQCRPVAVGVPVARRPPCPLCRWGPLLPLLLGQQCRQPQAVAVAVPPRRQALLQALYGPAPPLLPGQWRLLLSPLRRFDPQPLRPPLPLHPHPPRVHPQQQLLHLPPPLLLRPAAVLAALPPTTSTGQSSCPSPRPT